MQAAARRAWGNVEYDRHLGCSELLPCHEEEHLTVLIRKGGQGFGESGDGALGVQPIVNRVPGVRPARVASADASRASPTLGMLLTIGWTRGAPSPL